MANSVRVVDRGARRVVQSIGTMKGPLALVVGVMGKEGGKVHGQGKGATVAEIAAAHEFGLGVPERSWLRGWFDEHRTEIQEDLKKVSRAVILGRLTREQGLELLGVKYVGQIQARIATSLPPPNAEATIRKKGSSTTLIDSGQFRSAITSELERMSG